MSKPFAYADWNPKRHTVPAYYPDPQTDLITMGEVAVGDDGEPESHLGPLKRDDRTRTLVGWPHTVCQSFEGGSVLVPLKSSHTAGSAS